MVRKSESVLNVKNTEIIDIAEVIRAPNNKATKNNINDTKLTGNISLKFAGKIKAITANGTHLIIVAESLKPKCSANH